MFEKMVLSGAGRRERRLSKFFVGSLIAYIVMAGSALAVSIYVTDPKLTGFSTTITPPRFVALSGGNRRVDGPRTATASRPNPYNLRRLDDMPQKPMPVRIPILTTNLSLEGIAARGDGDSLDGNANGDGSGRFGVPGLAALDGVENPPRPVDKSKKPGETKQIEHPQRATPLKVSAGVLQGKAIDRKTPVYPQIARAIHREGSVLVEVMISPDGRVESARAVSGDPLLAKSAVDAAYGWRFQPTYLGDVPVRVTGMITFVFRLGD